MLRILIPGQDHLSHSRQETRKHEFVTRTNELSLFYMFQKEPMTLLL